MLDVYSIHVYTICCTQTPLTDPWVMIKVNILLNVVLEMLLDYIEKQNCVKIQRSIFNGLYPLKMDHKCCHLKMKRHTGRFNFIQTVGSIEKHPI